jgi:hypothetical protein
MTVGLYAHMKLKILIPVLLLIFIQSAIAAGPALSPGCFPTDCSVINLTKGEIVNTTFRVYNLGDRTDFHVFLENEIINFTKLSAEKFNLKTRQQGDCIPNNGCQLVTATFDLRKVPAGIYSGNFVAETVTAGAGSMALIQQVAARINIRVNLPPTWYNKLWTWSSDLANAAWKSIKDWYGRNSWVNYVFIALALILAYVLGFGIQRKYRKEWWEINIINVKGHPIYLLIDYEKERVLLARFAEKQHNLTQFVKEALKKNRPPEAIVVNKTEETDERFEIFLENNGIKFYYLVEEDVELELIEEAILKNVDIAGVLKLHNAQQHLNNLVRTIDEKRVKGIIQRKKAKKEAILKRHEKGK